MADLPVSCFMQGHQDYIQRKVNPILESMVTQVLLERPDDLVPFMINWLAEQDGGGGVARSPEFEEVAKQVRKHESRVAELQEKLESMRKDADKKADEEEEEEDEEEDEEDDDVDEMPHPPANYQSRGPRASVSAEAYGAWNQMQPFKAPVNQKTPDQLTRISSILECSFLFSGLDNKEMEVVINAMLEKNVEKGTVLIREGDDGDVLYVVEEGALECYKVIDGTERMVKALGPSDAFGELALLYCCPRAATVTATERCVLWQLDRETFNHIVKNAAMRKREKSESFLKSVPLLEGMEPYERSKVADALRTEKFGAGEAIVNQGDPADKFYIVEDGEAIATKSFVPGQIPQEVMAYKPGDYFGELALLHNEPRAANVVAKGPVRCLVLDRRSFKRLLGPLEEILRRNTKRYT